MLSNKEKRQTYDQFGKSGLNSSGMGSGGFSRGQAEEIFAQFFGGQDPFSVLFSQMGEGGMPGPGGAGVQFQFGGMPGMGGGKGGGMGGLPPGFAQMMGGMGGMPGMSGMPGGMGKGMRGSGRRAPAPPQPGTLPAGATVFVHGLQGAAQHNGKQGEVEDYDASAGRYLVNVGDNDVLRIKCARPTATRAWLPPRGATPLCSSAARATAVGSATLGGGCDANEAALGAVGAMAPLAATPPRCQPTAAVLTWRCCPVFRFGLACTGLTTCCRR